MLSSPRSSTSSGLGGSSQANSHAGTPAPSQLVSPGVEIHEPPNATGAGATTDKTSRAVGELEDPLGDPQLHNKMVSQTKEEMNPEAAKGVEQKGAVEWKDPPVSLPNSLAEGVLTQDVEAENQAVWPGHTPMGQNGSVDSGDPAAPGAGESGIGQVAGPTADQTRTGTETGHGDAHGL